MIAEVRDALALLRTMRIRSKDDPHYFYTDVHDDLEEIEFVLTSALEN